MNIQDIKFGNNKPNNIFSELSKNAAKYIKFDDNGKPTNSNKNTQIRKFYDELIMWHNKVFTNQNAEQRQISFDSNIPFIKMLKAKVAYAQARKSAGTTLVNENFRKVFNQCIDEIQSVETLRDAKLFMEATIAYCKYFEETKNPNL
ncbi:type III-A CRISPR-associated protein Csm2 [Conservatibacter flavescens]|uniref:CRISPR system Cms protein Csm2 n=1 Tax=Conservatibacter flavescens TaxID=28161 RepID=A0A2M8S393_9PAST|nr:type III-A CRISPR-associated protein Csm2 [Conservatibacter flavescens]PJG85614.1 type III-A CRISPR-associated protein Csm2 [Conservatibacter flavescens]